MRATNVSFNNEEHVKLNKAAINYDLSKSSILRYLVSKTLTKDGIFKIRPPKEVQAQSEEQPEQNEPQNDSENVQNEEIQQDTPNNEEVNEQNNWTDQENVEETPTEDTPEDQPEEQEQPVEQPQPAPQPQEPSNSIGQDFPNLGPTPNIQEPAQPTEEQSASNKKGLVGWLFRR